MLIMKQKMENTVWLTILTNILHLLWRAVYYVYYVYYEELKWLILNYDSLKFLVIFFSWHDMIVYQ